MPSNLSTNSVNLKVKKYYNDLNINYLECFGSEAKKDINNFESNFIDGVLKEVCKNGRKPKVLEIGFGPGRITSMILKQNVEYYGVDISDKMAEELKKRIKGNEKIKEIIVSDMENGELLNNVKFDLIVAFRVLYYSNNWRKIISNLSEKLNPTGTFVFTMPNLFSLAVLGNLMGGIKGHYTTKKELKGILVKNEFKGKIIGFARIPDTIYDLCNSGKSALVLRKIESCLRSIFGSTSLAKMLYVFSEKEGGEIK